MRIILNRSNINTTAINLHTPSAFSQSIEPARILPEVIEKTPEFDQRHAMERLSEQARKTGEAMEKLSALELGIYTALAAKDVVFNRRFPKAVILANAFESVVEWLTNKMIGGEEKGGTLAKPFEIIGNLAAQVCGVKNASGAIVKNSKELLENRGKVTGALVTSINGIGLLNSLATIYSGFFSRKQHTKENGFLSAISIFAPALNAVSMLVCSVLKEAFGKALELNSAPKQEKDHQLINSLLTAANEDGRCALKSGLAMVVDILDAAGFKYAVAIDGIAGLLLNVFGLQNGFSSLKGHAEEEQGFSLNLMKSVLAKPLYKLGEIFTQISGVPIPDFQAIKKHLHTAA